MAGVLILTAAVVAMTTRDEPATPTVGHAHGAGPDPITAVVLGLDVLVLVVLAVLARRWPPGVRRPAPARKVWRYRGRPLDD
ncbi:hypothetical protein J2S43_000927 [Catenuloplanes nepalensis]|uniref:Uncharacterized protein n=1 Tax=Catenuloplanes nepalensis TaxID=587533 RepID=A0ABT9MLX5_9ACTN|nr:hypothetical protein [Catenuloplanes nepalensis]MDP9792415.1 hypothetical protein [Catenuloplanes nepalensis]